MKRLCLAGILVSLAVGSLATVAAAAGGRLEITPAGPIAYPGRAYVLTLPKKTALNPSQVTVTENGEPVDSPFVGVPGVGGAKAGTVVLLDESNSMRGAPIAAALVAARALAAKRNPGQELAILAFNDKVATLVPFTASQAQIDEALSKTPKLREKTHIYDGLSEALALMQKSDIAAGSIVLLSDGTDVGSAATQDDILSRLQAAHVRVFSVGLRSPQFDPNTLSAVAETSGGSYTEASSPEALKPIFSQLGSRLANEYLVTYRSLIGPKKAVQVRVQVAGFPGAAAATYETPSIQSVPVTYHRSAWNKLVTSSVAAAIVAIAVIGLLAYALINIVRGPDIALRRRMSQFVHVATDAEAHERHVEIRGMLARRAERSFGNREWWQNISEDCDIAGIRRSPASLALWATCGGFGVGIILALIFHTPLLIIPGVIVGPMVAHSYIQRRLRATREAFADQLPDNLDVLASALRVGHSLAGALAVVVADAAEPSRSEFQRVIADEQLGVPLDEALQVTVTRMDSRDLDQVAVVAALQRDAGGNAAEVLDQVSENIRGRQEVRRLVRTLTAQGRMARWIVSLLPVVLLIGIVLLNTDYERPLWTTTVGQVALVMAVILVLTGSYIIKRIVEIKV